MASQVARSLGARSVSTARTSCRRAGVGTPRNGIVDFMYRCISGAAAGSAERRQPVAEGAHEAGVGRHGWAAPQALTIGSSSAGDAPWRITPSAPRSNWRWITATHCSGEPMAAGASHSAGISVATCSSCSVVAVWSMAPR